MRPLDRAEQRERGLAHAVRCRPCGRAAGRTDAPASEPSRDHAAGVERAARSARRSGERGDGVAVAPQRDRPGDAVLVLVLVDLELDLDAAVFAAELQLARRLLGAHTLDADGAMVARLRKRGRHCEECDGEEGDGDSDGRAGHCGSPFVRRSGLTAASRSPGPSRNETLVRVAPGPAPERRS